MSEKERKPRKMLTLAERVAALDEKIRAAWAANLSSLKEAERHAERANKLTQKRSGLLERARRDAEAYQAMQAAEAKQ